MAGDENARCDDVESPPAPTDPAGSREAPWVTYEPAPVWPGYDPQAGDVEGVHDAVPRRGRRERVVAACASLVIAAAGVCVVVARGAGVPVASEPGGSEPKPVSGPQWTPVDPSLTSGLVRVQVTATVEADGIVLTKDGLVATSYARLVGLNGSAASIEAVELNVVADGGMPMRAEIIGFDASADVAVLRVPGYTTASVATLGTPVKRGEELMVLDDVGVGQPVVGYPVTISATKQPCSRMGAAMISRPTGFQFSLAVASAEPGGAIVRDDGSVVGMYYGGDHDPRCGVPIADVARVVRDVARHKQTSTTRVGPPGGLGIQLYGPDDTYPGVTSIDAVGGLANAAGVRLGDVLTRVGTTSLRDRDLTTRGPDGVIRSLEPGQKVTIEWRSGGATHRASVQVGVGPEPHG